MVLPSFRPIVTSSRTSGTTVVRPSSSLMTSLCMPEVPTDLRPRAHDVLWRRPRLKTGIDGTEPVSRVNHAYKRGDRSMVEGGSDSRLRCTGFDPDRLWSRGLGGRDSCAPWVVREPRA